MLDERLLACASMIRKGAKVCDVGTDHAYLPCYLVSHNLSHDVTAADVNEKPLETAKRTIAEAGLSGKIKTVLSDGLEKIDSDTEDVVIAGMGGELIAKILFSCPWSKEFGKHFILQPMTNTPYLRKALYQEGFEIIKEQPVLERGHFYSVLLCCWNGNSQEISPFFSLVGKIAECHSPEAEQHIRYQMSRMEKIALGRKAAKDPEKRRDAEYFERLALELHQYLEQKNKTGEKG